jgi:hypothetical protein
MKINPTVKTHNPHQEDLEDFLDPYQIVMGVLLRRLSRMIFDRKNLDHM